MTTTGNNSSTGPPEDSLIKLIGEASAEIDVYRHRQINTFREAVIVQALITWGVSQLKLQANASGWVIRVLAGFACLVAGLFGLFIIRSYKSRIYHIRDNRNKLAKLVLEKSGRDTQVSDLFYPTTANIRPTSNIYSWTLIVLGILTLAVNLLAGWAVLLESGKP